MALELILPIVTPLIIEPIRDYAIAPIKRHASYAFKCDSKLQGLQEQVEQLQSKKLRLQQSVDDAMRSGAEVFPDVSKWLTAAEKDIGEAEELIQRKDNAMKNKCFFGFCPNLKTRYQLSKKAEKKALAIGKLCNQEGLDSISFQPHLQQIVEPSLYTREALPSRVLLLNQVMDALRDPNLNTIGVFGMGGVGKTTFAKEVQARSLQEKLFETVVLVAVSQAPEIRRIQGEISDFLGLKFTAEEIPKRASELFRRLENSNVLIILDDLWEKLDLNAVGIPSLGASKGCKIMLTSRSMDLLSSEMRVQKLFALEALKEEETLCLFEMSIAEAKDPKFRHIATQIANKCGGLPLLVQIVATDLTNKELYEWSNKLNQLSAFDDEEIYQKVYRVLESSYENLPGEEIKQFFLVCALFGPSNIQIQYLLTHSMGLGLFKRIHTVEAARDKVLTLISKLKAKSLLLDGDMDGYVKMHDVVRDTALSIASRLQHAYIGAGEVRFRDWQSRDCTRISLPYCNVSELPEGLDFPEAEVLLLFTDNLSLEIPDPFFEGMKKLKVADLRGMRLVSFPSSFGLLANLRTLCLLKCRLDNLAVVGELKQLEILSFANSNLVELPRELEALTQLKLLDLQGCSDLQVIHANLFSRLFLLEEIYMLNSFVRWNAKGNVCLVELENLARLSTLEIEIPDLKVIPIGFKCFSQLTRYKISIGPLWDWKGQPEGSRMLKLKVEEGVSLVDDIELLLRETENLFIDGVRGIERSIVEGFPKLKHMHVENDFDVQELIKLTMPASSSAFPVLESLYLKNLWKLGTICSGQLGMGSFGELRILKISHCHKLRSLFSFSSLKCLQKLRELEVEYCENMEAVVGERNYDERHDNEGIELTQLSSLRLLDLPHLIGFCNIEEGTEQSGMLFNTMVSFPNLTSLEVLRCNSLKHIFTGSMVKCLMQLQNLRIYDCELVEAIVEDSTEAIVFAKLDNLLLEDLQIVKRFSSCYAVKFPSLKALEISNCRAMENFVGRDSISESTEECLFNEMVNFSKLETLEISCNDSIKYLWDEQSIADDSFSKLKSISIRICSKLSVVFPSKICTRFRRVETLSLSGCDAVEGVYQRMDLKEVNSPFSLRELHVYDLRSLKHIWNKESEWNKGPFSTFQNLQTVAVVCCEDLKYVFPASVGCGLPQLQQLRVAFCNQLEVMVAKAKDDGGIDASFQFPHLKKLELEDLKEMSSLYEGGPHTFECPNLNSLTLVQCSNNISPVKFISNVEEVMVDEQGFHAIHGCADGSAGFSYKLKKVTLRSLNEESSRGIISRFLSAFKYLEMVVLESCSVEEIFRLHDALGDEHHHRLRVKHLQLRDIEMLNYITREDSHGNRTLQYLQTLHLERCHDLMGIAPSSTCLQNLTTLRVYNCYTMRHLVTASTAKTMVHLIEIEVAFCNSIEVIVANDGDSEEHDTMLTFNKLECLELSELPNFNSFCSNKYTFGFPLLERVVIVGCPSMKIFGRGAVLTPKLRGVRFDGEQQWEGNLNATITSQLRTWVGENLEDGIRFHKLESLQVANSTSSSKAVLLANQMHFLNELREITVRDCHSTQVVFDLEGLSAEGRYIELLPQLKQLELVNLPSLTQICSKQPMGILDFNSLRELEIDNCSRLEYALTWSMASCLFQLKRVEVKNCEMMETFIMDEEDVAAKVTFDELKNFSLENMPKFSSIYSGSGDLEFPSLKKVTISECPSIKPSLISTKVQSINQVSLKLKLSLDMKSVRGMLQSETPTDLLSNLRILELRHWSSTTTSHADLVRFLSKLLNLDQLKLRDSSFQELLSSNTEETLTLPRIKSLKLISLVDMNKIWWHASLFQSLETLKVVRCGNLINLASSSASFQNLATLTVSQCGQLLNLITPSIAKSMVQLKLLRVDCCDMLIEIVGNGSDHETDEIVLPNLKRLELTGLQSLKAFSLTSYNFSFPCLDSVTFHGCPNLRIFCNGIVNTTILNCVYDWEYNETGCWEGNLNSTTKCLYDKMVGIEIFSEIRLSTFPVLKEKWEVGFPSCSFPFLKRLEVDNCELYSNAVPSHLLKHLKTLEVLIVEKCNYMEQVVDFEGLNATENKMRSLEELQLLDLPKLKQVWSKDPQHILSFENLHTLKVENCGSLTYIFDLSMALSLRNLQCVEVKNCSLVEHIILISEEETVQQYQTILPSLQSMTLLHLANLVRFCSKSEVLEFPSLKTFEVVDCPNVEVFASLFLEGQHSSITGEDPDLISSFLGNKIVVPGLEELKVEWKALKVQLFGNYRSRFLSKLKCIELTSFQGEEDANFPPNFPQHFLSLEKLCLTDSLIEEITLANCSNHKDDDNEPLLTRLKLSNFPMLKHLVCDDCEPIPLFENLVDLEAIECSSLKILVPSSVSFLNLTDLLVSKCDGLINLFSTSTARSLVQLRRMQVKDCKMMPEIVAVALDGEEYEIQFSQLEYLELDGLPCLESFSSGNYEFHFPSLKEVIIRGCPNMKNFTEKVSVSPKLRKVQTGRHEYDWEWEGSLNNTIQALYMQKVFKN